MFHFVNTWQFNIIAYLVVVVIFSQSYKLAVRNAKDDTAATVLLQIIAGAVALLLIPLFSFRVAGSWHWWLLLVAACLFYAVSDRLQTTNRKHLEVSLFSIIQQFTTVMLVFYGVVIYNNHLGWAGLGGVVLVIMANVLVLLKRGQMQLNKYIGLSLIASVVFATAITIDINVSKQFNLPLYVAITLLLPGLMIMIADRAKPSEVVAEWKHSPQKYYWITGIAWAFLIVFSLRAYQLSSEATIAPLAALAVFLNVVVAFFVFKERDSRLKKIIAAIMIIIGTWLIVG